MLTTTAAPLSADHLRMLRTTTQLARLETRLFIGGTVAVVLGAAVAIGLSLNGVSLPRGNSLWAVVLAVAAVLLFAGFLLRRARRQRGRFLAPAAQALAAGQITVTHGHLDRLEPAKDGGLRYTVSGETLQLFPLAGPFDGPNLDPSTRIQQLTHLGNQEVVLHWLPLAPQQGLLLEAHYPDAQPVRFNTRPSSTDDHRRAMWQEGTLILILIGAFAVAALLGGFGAAQTALILKIALACCGAITALSGLWVWRQRGRGLELATLTASLTEHFITMTSGEQPITHHWFRVGGWLFSPAMPGTRPDHVGALTIVEWLRDGNADAGDTLVSFAAGADTETGASGEAFREAETANKSSLP